MIQLQHNFEIQSIIDTQKKRGKSCQYIMKVSEVFNQKILKVRFRHEDRSANNEKNRATPRNFFDTLG